MVFIQYNPETFDELEITDKTNFKKFIDKKFQTKDINICFVGKEDTCITQICELYMNEFLHHQNFSKYHYKLSQVIYKFNCYDETNVPNSKTTDKHNDLIIFCQNNICLDKLIYVNNFDELTDIQQQYFKYLYDKFTHKSSNNKQSNIYFLLSCASTGNVKDFIRSRITTYEIPKLSKYNLKSILKVLLQKYQIKLEQKCIDNIINQRGITLCSLYSIITKLYINNQYFKVYKWEQIENYTCIINYDVFDTFISLIRNKRFYDACEIFEDLYVQGYDLSDIYFFFYQYLKNLVFSETACEQYIYRIIERLCFYINEHMNGNFERIIIYLFVFDIMCIFHPEINSQKFEFLN